MPTQSERARETVPVTQDDREAAASIAAPSPTQRKQCLTGQWDEGSIVQAFAQHRIAALSSPIGGGVHDAIHTALRLCDDARDECRPDGEILLPGDSFKGMCGALDKAHDLLHDDGPSDESEEDAYQIGKRDGREEAIQEIDLATGGDGEYRYCTNYDPERHCPDPETMKARILARLGGGVREGVIEECKQAVDDALAVYSCNCLSEATAALSSLASTPTDRVGIQ